ncbi:unnamed protein product [Protopolystoma xenopodis]|uniref:Uncharacterized protein n=1 Tax=Protopolystoma xenopodis TaxID=117903 RepID=A0A448WSY1_9PLAT|nr:unnamed protein product [Protopolystoma xenopodis]
MSSWLYNLAVLPGRLCESVCKCIVSSMSSYPLPQPRTFDHMTLTSHGHNDLPATRPMARSWQKTCGQETTTQHEVLIDPFCFLGWSYSFAARITRVRFAVCSFRLSLPNRGGRSNFRGNIA